MEKDKLTLVQNVNNAIIRYRAAYADWANVRSIGYNEMLVFYTLRDYEFCTQKQISEDYHIPTQTIHNVINRLKKENLIIENKEKKLGREKAFHLTRKGEEYAKKLLENLSNAEERVINTMGVNKVETLYALLNEYQTLLSNAIDEADK